jgi:hypothetical protein
LREEGRKGGREEGKKGRREEGKTEAPELCPAGLAGLLVALD